MKNNLKRLLCIGMTGVLLAALLTGCFGKEKKENTMFEAIPESNTEPSGSGEKNTNMANPWVDITETEAKTLCTRLFKAPDGATGIRWSKLTGSESNSATKTPLVQLNFTLDGMDYCARAQAGADEKADISGMYYTWVAEDDVTLANWGMGNMKGRTHRAMDDQGYADLINWYDIEIGIAYTLSVTAPDLEGFDIQAVAESMYDPANEPTNDMPD